MRNAVRPATPDPAMSDRRFAWIALALYLVLGIVLLLHHEAWRDEADTWLIARDAPLPAMPMLLGRKGTPALWNLILIPFARAGLPYATQAVLHLAIAGGAGALLFFAAPFPRMWKVLIAFSYYMGYEYLAIARPYTLTVLLLFAMAACHRKRIDRPLLFAAIFALFVNSTVHALLVGALIGPLFAWEMLRQRVRGGRAATAVMALGGAVAGLPLLLAGRGAVVPFVHAPVPPVALEAVAAAFAPQWDIVAGVVGLAVFVLATAAARRERNAVAVLWLSWAALLFIDVFVYRGTLRHYGLLLYALLFSLWIAGPESTKPAGLRMAIMLSLVLSAVSAVFAWVQEVREPFSDSKEAAAYLVAHHLERRPIAAHPPGSAEAVLAYLPPRRFWYPVEKREGSFMQWNASLLTADAVPPDRVMAEALQGRRRNPELLVLSDAPLTVAPRFGLRLLYATHGTPFRARRERYWIYGAR